MSTWTLFARRRHAPLSARLLQEAQQPEAFEAATEIPVGLHNHVWLDDAIYVRADEEARLRSALAERIQPGQLSFLESFAGRCRAAVEDLTLVAEDVARDVGREEPSQVDLAETSQRWISAYRRAMSFVPVFRMIDRVLASQLSGPEAAALLSGGPGALTEEARERAELHAIVVRLRAIGDLEARSVDAAARIEGHVDRFGWLGTRWHLGEPFSTSDVHRRVVALLASRTPLPPPAPVGPAHAEHDHRLVEELAFLRSHRAEAINKAIWVARPLFTAIGDRAGLDYGDVVHLLPLELLALASGGAVPPRELIDRRRVRFATALIDDGYQDLAGDEDVAALRQRLGLDRYRAGGEMPADSPSIPVLRGVIASRGHARGAVKVVRADAGSDRKVGDGDVLVTTMTFPSLVGSMQRSAAIVTDDGGLLSHAAITARELGKPCLIDTRHATEVFADGDLVEVDCEAGYVRLIDSPKRRPEEAP